MRRIERIVLEEWVAADTAEANAAFRTSSSIASCAPRALEPLYEIDPRDSWLLAAAKPTCRYSCRAGRTRRLGTCSRPTALRAGSKSTHTVKLGHRVHDRARRVVSPRAAKASIGFFQIGGGIAGDFPICVVPMLHQDLRLPDVPLWGYFCQISDSTTSYGSYSGAVPNEKITWGKLAVDTPKFVIESDATIVVPLVFAKVLGW